MGHWEGENDCQWRMIRLTGWERQRLAVLAIAHEFETRRAMIRSKVHETPEYHSKRRQYIALVQFSTHLLSKNPFVLHASQHTATPPRAATEGNRRHSTTLHCNTTPILLYVPVRFRPDLVHEFGPSRHSPLSASHRDHPVLQISHIQLECSPLNSSHLPRCLETVG